MPGSPAGRASSGGGAGSSAAAGASSAGSTVVAGSSAGGAPTSPPADGWANSLRCPGPKASCSWRATSSGSAPCWRLSSRCSRMASSSSPIATSFPFSLLRLHGAVLPRTLRLIQRGVRGGHQTRLVGRLGAGQRRGAEGGGHLEAAVAVEQRQLERLDPLADALGEAVGAGQVGLRQRD